MSWRNTKAYFQVPRSQFIGFLITFPRQICRGKKRKISERTMPPSRVAAFFARISATFIIWKTFFQAIVSSLPQLIGTVYSKAVRYLKAGIAHIHELLVKIRELDLQN